jgi:hypothetical protein
MSYLNYLKRLYPNTYKVRYALQQYKAHIEWEHQEPTTLTIHETTLNYGGPEEGSWFYESGYPCLTHCIFNKKQAIQNFIYYCDEYGTWDQPDLGLTSTVSNYDINFSNDYAKIYPTERPHYE